MDTLKRATIAAVALSYTLVCTMLLLATAVARESQGDITPVVTFVAVLVLTYATIFQWMRCARMYIDHAIDRRLGTSANAEAGKPG
jgi:fatty acid desaturase